MTSFGFDFGALPKREESSLDSTYCNEIKGNGSRTTTANIQLWKAPGSSTWTARPSTRENALALDLNERLNQIPLPVPVYSPALMGSLKHHRRSSIFSTLRRKTRWTNPRSRWRSPPRSLVFLSGAATEVLGLEKSNWHVPEEDETVGVPPSAIIARYDHRESGGDNCLNSGVDGISSDDGKEEADEEDRPSSPYSDATSCPSDRSARTGEHRVAAGTTAPTSRVSCIKLPDPQELRSRRLGETSTSCLIWGNSRRISSLSSPSLRSSSSSVYSVDSGDEAVVSSAFAMPVGPAITAMGKARVLRARQISVRRCFGRYTSVPQATDRPAESPTAAPSNERGPGIPIACKTHQPSSPDLDTKRVHLDPDRRHNSSPSRELHRIVISNFNTDIDASSFYSDPEDPPIELDSISDIMVRRQSKNSAGETVGLQLLVSTLFNDSSDEEEEIQHHHHQQHPYISEEEEEEELSPRQKPVRRRPEHDHRYDHYNVNRNSIISTSSSGVGSDIYSPISRAPAPRKYSCTSTSTAPTAYSVHSLEVPSTANSAKRFSIVISEPGADAYGDDEMSPRFPRTYDFPIPRKASTADLGLSDSRRSSTVSYEDRARASSPMISAFPMPKRAESRQSVRESSSRQSLREAEARGSYEERNRAPSPRMPAFPIPKRTASWQSVRESQREPEPRYEERNMALSPRMSAFPIPKRAESRQSVRESGSRQSPREVEPRVSYEEREMVPSPRMSAFPIPKRAESRQSLRASESRQSIRASESHQSLRTSSRMEMESERRRSSAKPVVQQRPEERELAHKISYLALQGSREQGEALHVSDPEDEDDETIFDEYHKHLSMSSRNRRPGPSIPLQLGSSAKLARMLSPEASPIITAFPSKSRLRSSSRPQPPMSPQSFRFPPTSISNTTPPRTLSKAEKLTGAPASQLWPGPAPRRQRRRTASSDCLDAEIESNIREHSLPPVPPLPILTHSPSARNLAMSAPGPIVPSRKSSRHELARKPSRQRSPPPPPPHPMNVEFDLTRPPHTRQDGDARKGHARSVSGETTRTRIAVNGFWDADPFGRMVLPGLPVELVQA